MEDLKTLGNGSSRFKIMSLRVKIPLPLSAEVLYQGKITVRITDLNFGNHLANQNVLTYAHQARCEYFRALGQSEMRFFGTSLIMSDAMIQFQSEAYFMDTLDFYLYLGDYHGAAFDLIYLFKKDNQDIARVKTAMVFYSYQKRRVERLPQNFKEMIVPIRTDEQSKSE